MKQKKSRNSLVDGTARSFAWSVIHSIAQSAAIRTITGIAAIMRGATRSDEPKRQRRTGRLTLMREWSLIDVMRRNIKTGSLPAKSCLLPSRPAAWCRNPAGAATQLRRAIMLTAMTPSITSMLLGCVAYTTWNNIANTEAA